MSTNSILFLVTFTLLLICLFFIIKMHFRLKKLFRGSKAQTLETLMNNIVQNVNFLNEKLETNEKGLEFLASKISKQGHCIKMTRFNPFKDVGGNQSFAVAITNEEGDGVVISSLYSRERMSVFAKPISNGSSDIELSEEEKNVVSEAQKEAQNNKK